MAAASGYGTNIRYQRRCPIRGRKPLLAHGATLPNKWIVPIIAVLSIATAAAADAKPKHGLHKRGHASHVIVCDERGCSDRVVAGRAAGRTASADATPQRVRQRKRARRGNATVICNLLGCSDRVLPHRARASTNTADSMSARGHRLRDRARSTHAQVICDERGCSDRIVASRAEGPRVLDAHGNAVILGGRPPGCPRAFCGCEASLYLFGEIRRELNLASNWIRKFPRASAAPGMVAARSDHVMVLISHAGDDDWLVHDGNSGGGLTRRHVRSIRGYVIVDPNGSRSAGQ